jgi:hypothetical protein
MLVCEGGVRNRVERMGMRLGDVWLVLNEDGNLYLHVIFSQTVTLPEIGVDAKVIAVDANENVIVYGNGDPVEGFETNEGIIRTRYFLKRRRIQPKIRGRQLRRSCWRNIKGENGKKSGDLLQGG